MKWLLPFLFVSIDFYGEKKLKIIQIFGTSQRFFLVFSRRINIFSSAFFLKYLH